MIGAQVTIVINPALAAKLRSVSRAVADRGIKDGLSGAAFVVEGAAKVNIQEKDIIEFGNLLNSVQAQEPKITSRGGEVEVAVGAEYGIYHEYGTYKMAARPFMRPAVDEHIPEITQAFNGGVERALRGAVS